MSTCSKRIHEVKHTLHLNDESKHLDNFHVQFPRSHSETKTLDSQTDVYTGIPTFTFRNKNTGLTNRCLHRHFHVQIQKQKHWTHKQMFKAYNTQNRAIFTNVTLVFLWSPWIHSWGASLSWDVRLPAIYAKKSSITDTITVWVLNTPLYLTVNWAHKFSALISHFWTRDCLIGLTDN